ncbi:MAG: redoxin [Flavobacteriaceae bacterium]|nr:redoxin [Flavobacteriaceae bacterium]|tara:strand:- start:27294 stop:28328 length:1035 start_codon:yes stop_codon:yes gene_type:complete
MLRRFTLIFLLVAFVSCDSAPEGYLKFSGKLENNKDSVMTLLGYRGFSKSIPINADGSFSDTIKVKFPGIYSMQTNKNNRAPIFLDNGYNLKLKGNSEEFITSFKYSGKGSQNSNYLVSQVKFGRSIPNPQILNNMEEDAFKAKLESIKKGYDSILDSYKDLDTTLVSNTRNQTKELVYFLNGLYERNRKVGIGGKSPKFENYVNYKGGKTSLDDFKGSFVYIDVWATWCGPCIQQIPYLKKIEKEFRNKKIAFVSISTDEPRKSGGSWEAAEKKWRNFVKAKNLGGVQLWSGKDFSFQQAYQINGIPRFILVDDQGNIRAYNAPRPSDPALKVLLNSVGLKDK